MATINQLREKVVDGIIQAIQSNGSTLANLGENITVNEINNIISQGMVQQTISPDGISGTSPVMYQQDFGSVQGYGSQVDNDVIDQIVSTCCSGYGMDGTMMCNSPIEELSFTGNYVSDDGDGDAWQGHITFNECPGSGGDGLAEFQLADIREFLTGLVQLSGVRQSFNAESAASQLAENVFELLPDITSRQQRILALFNEFDDLVGPSPSTQTTPGSFEVDVDNDNISDTWTNLSEKQDTWNENYGITNTPGGNIIRLNKHVKPGELNENKTLEYLRNRINEYLTDIDKQVNPVISDTRPEYINKNENYLKFRNLNQAIIIRKEEGGIVEFNRDILVPDNHPWKQLENSPVSGPSYLVNGFTITMWVRFLDRVSDGTLFNFGNPFREYNPSGIRLETYIVNKETYSENFGEDSIPEGFFENNTSERFLRLCVRDHLNPQNQLGYLYDNNFPQPNEQTEHVDTKLLPNLSSVPVWNYTRIPVKYSEWYCIVATYNPFIDDETYESNFKNNVGGDTPSYEYYHNNFDPLNNKFVHQSGYGNKCKIEIISRSDLLRARGFKTNT